MQKIFLKNIRGFYSAVGECLTLSWRTSRLYTVFRLLCNLNSAIADTCNSGIRKVYSGSVVWKCASRQLQNIFAGLCWRAPSRQYNPFLTAKGVLSTGNGAF